QRDRPAAGRLGEEGVGSTAPHRGRRAARRCQMSRLWMRIACGLVLGLCATPALAVKPDLSRRPSLPAPPHRKPPVPPPATTPAGSRLVVLSQHELPVVHVVVTIPAGSALDPANRP